MLMPVNVRSSTRVDEPFKILTLMQEVTEEFRKAACCYSLSRNNIKLIKTKLTFNAFYNTSQTEGIEF
jgi:hypothetical protein